MKMFIAYYRVSTKQQGDSGLGLEAQQATVESFVKRETGKLQAVYLEVESGKRADRPQLALALAHAKRSRAILIVAKLDRLARNVAFTAALMESGADFVACDNPTANRLTIHILAAVAEDEARRISERTKAALTAAKARGTKLGAANPKCQNLTNESRRRGAVTGSRSASANAKAAAEEVRELLTKMRKGGFGYQDIANLLNEQGHVTRHNKQWSDIAVMRACQLLQIDAGGVVTQK